MFGSASAPLPGAPELVWTLRGRIKPFYISFEGVGLSRHACQGYHSDLTIWTSFWGVQRGPVGLEDCVIVPLFFVRASWPWTEHRDARVRVVQ